MKKQKRALSNTRAKSARHRRNVVETGLRDDGTAFQIGQFTKRPPHLQPAETLAAAAYHWDAGDAFNDHVHTDDDQANSAPADLQFIGNVRTGADRLQRLLLQNAYRRTVQPLWSSLEDSLVMWSFPVHDGGRVGLAVTEHSGSRCVVC